MAMALTRRQREVFDFIREFIQQKGYSPSLEEIGSNLGLSSVATVHKHVQHLVEKGRLRKSWNRSRSVEPVPEDDEETLTVPLLGTVAAGAPIEAIEVSESIEVPRAMVGNPAGTFVLRVVGDSMIDEQIREGDYVVVDGHREAQEGETVVALLGGEDATLKKLYRDGPNVRLVPANARLQPLVVPADQVKIRGVVRGLLRRY